jgi:hypothetical protein
VQRGTGGGSNGCPATAAPLPLLSPVDPAQSFVLASFAGVGANYDGDDLSTAVLTDGGVVIDPNAQPCSDYEYQVVTLPGTSVLRGELTSAFAVGSRTQSVNGLPMASANAVLLHGARVTSTIPNTLSMCHLFVRGDMPTTTSLRFSRGADALPGLCEFYPLDRVTWERVDFGTHANVQHFTVSTGGNRINQAIAAVDPTRALVFAGGQQAGGTATGETSLNDTGGDNIGSATARFELLASTSVDVTRGRSQATGAFTFYVVELEP